MSNKSNIAIKSGGPSIRPTWLETKRILASFPLSFSPPLELEGAQCSPGRVTAPAGRSPRNDTLINVFFYLLSQGLARVCKHSTAFAESPALASNYAHLPLETLARACAPLDRSELPTHPGPSHAPGKLPEVLT